MIPLNKSLGMLLAKTRAILETTKNSLKSIVPTLRTVVDQMFLDLTFLMYGLCKMNNM